MTGRDLTIMDRIAIDDYPGALEVSPAGTVAFVGDSHGGEADRIKVLG